MVSLLGQTRASRVDEAIMAGVTESAVTTIFNRNSSHRVMAAFVGRVESHGSIESSTPKDFTHAATRD